MSGQTAPTQKGTKVTTKKWRRSAFVGVLALALAPLGAPTASASTASVAAWFDATGNAVVVSLEKAGKEANTDPMGACALFEAAANRGLAKPYPPNARIAFHWGAALAYYQAGAAECVAAFDTPNKTLLNDGFKYINAGAAQLRTVVDELGSLLGAKQRGGFG